MKKLFIGIVLILCFLSHQYISGGNRICVYDCDYDGQVAITVPAWDLCPDSIEE